MRDTHTLKCDISHCNIAYDISLSKFCYGVALVSRIDTIIGLFCKRALQKRQYSAKETYNLIDPTICSHPTRVWMSHFRRLKGSAAPAEPKNKMNMGWLQLVGSLKLQVSFAEYRLFYKALLQKRLIFVRRLHIVASPYELIAIQSVRNHLLKNESTSSSMHLKTNRIIHWRKLALQSVDNFFFEKWIVCFLMNSWWYHFMFERMIDDTLQSDRVLWGVYDV